MGRPKYSIIAGGVQPELRVSSTPTCMPFSCRYDVSLRPVGRLKNGAGRLAVAWAALGALNGMSNVAIGAHGVGHKGLSLSEQQGSQCQERQFIKGRVSVISIVGPRSGLGKLRW